MLRKAEAENPRRFRGRAAKDGYMAQLRRKILRLEDFCISRLPTDGIEMQSSEHPVMRNPRKNGIETSPEKTL